MAYTLDLSPDELLTTTRAVRRRLDLERPVDLKIIKDCIGIALQAPSGSNRQGWHWVVVNHEGQRARIAELYRAAFYEYRKLATHPGGLFAAAVNHQQRRVARSVEYLAENLHRVPVLVIACIAGPSSSVLLDANQASIWGSLFPAVWSYMLAARARGLGTVWTDLHLRYEAQIAEILEIPDEIRQGAMIPTAHTIGKDFRPGPRTAVDTVLHINRW